MNNENNFSEDTAKDAQEILNKAGKKADRKIGGALRKKIGQAVKRGTSNITKAGTKAIKSVAKSIVAMIGPVGIMILVIVILLFATWDFLFESRGKEQAYQTETMSQENPTKKDENGDIVATGLSQGNKIVKAFYTYFAEQSYYFMVEDDKTLYNPKTKPYPDKNLKDKYDREKMFYLNPNSLWALDEFLNNDKFRFPEQFVQPVYADLNTFTLKDLVDNKGKLVVDSKAYTDDGDIEIPIENKKVKGVWDYGFASILHYEKFTETKKGKGEVTKIEDWDAESMTKFVRETTSSEREKIEEMLQGYPKKVYMIDKVISPAGNISNKIEDIEEDTEIPWLKEITFTRVVPKWRMVTVTSTHINELGETVTTSHEEKQWYNDTEVFTKYVEGTIWEKIPKYIGDPDTSQITGTKYFKDYFENYVSYIPKDVMTSFDFTERTKKTEQDLLNLLMEDETYKDNSYAVDMSNFQLGTGASSDSYKKSLQYLPLFQKYGDMYGIDPYLLVSKASQESGGRHEDYISADRASVGGVGIMQIEKPGRVITDAKAYNFQTKKEDYMPITGLSSVDDIEENIKAGAMIYASRVKANNYNMLLSIQAYNYGAGGINAVLKLYSQASGKSISEIRDNPQDIGWLSYRYEVHKNPSKYFSWGSGTYGDPLYVEHVLRYYANPNGTSPYVLKEDGSKIEAMDLGNIETGEASGISITGVVNNMFSWITGIWEDIKAGFNSLFPEVNPVLPKERLKFDNYIPETRTQEIINMMYVMEERKYFSEYDDKDDNYWKERIAELFRNPLGTSWNSTDGGINPGDYFSNGYQSPVKLNPAQISKGYGNVTTGNNSEFHSGVDIIAPNGTSIYAVADGTVSKINNDVSNSIGKYIEINHGKSVYTLYGNLSSIKVKAGDSITKGQEIGASGNSGSENTYALHFELKKEGTPCNPTWIVTGDGAFIGDLPPLSPEATEKAKKVIIEAYKHAGKPYVWGATGQIITPSELSRLKNTFGAKHYPQNPETLYGKQGFDCSGFTFYVFKQALGISIPRTTETLWKELPRVQNYKAEPGDLIITHNRGHVMLYLGNNKAINAPSSGDVVKVTTVNWKNINGVVRALK